MATNPTDSYGYYWPDPDESGDQSSQNPALPSNPEGYATTTPLTYYNDSNWAYAASQEAQPSSHAAFPTSSQIHGSMEPPTGYDDPYGTYAARQQAQPSLDTAFPTNLQVQGSMGPRMGYDMAYETYAAQQPQQQAESSQDAEFSTRGPSSSNPRSHWRPPQNTMSYWPSTGMSAAPSPRPMSTTLTGSRAREPGGYGTHYPGQPQAEAPQPEPTEGASSSMPTHALRPSWPPQTIALRERGTRKRLPPPAPPARDAPSQTRQPKPRSTPHDTPGQDLGGRFVITSQTQRTQTVPETVHDDWIDGPSSYVRAKSPCTECISMGYPESCRLEPLYLAALKQYAAAAERGHTGFTLQRKKPVQVQKCNMCTRYDTACDVTEKFFASESSGSGSGR